MSWDNTHFTAFRKIVSCYEAYMEISVKDLACFYDMFFTATMMEAGFINLLMCTSAGWNLGYRMRKEKRTCGSIEALAWF
jgi:hypothetical protein